MLGVRLQEIFEEIVARCVEAGLVKGEHMSVDGSFIQANADHHSRVPREPLPEIAKVNLHGARVSGRTGAGEPGRTSGCTARESLDHGPGFDLCDQRRTSALYDLLRNRLYLGETRHRDQWYPGEHQSIVPLELWDMVQAQLTTNRRARRHRVRERSSSLLRGLVEDANGNRFTPSFTIKNGRRYRYYVPQVAIKNPAGQSRGLMRLPAHEAESRITEKLQAFLKSDAEVFDELSAPGESPAAIQPLVAAAKKLGAAARRRTSGP